MITYSKREIELHRIGMRLQKDIPYWQGLRLEQLEIASGWSYGTVCNALNDLEEKGKATSRRTEAGNREHGTIRFRGRIPMRRSL